MFFFYKGLFQTASHTVIMSELVVCTSSDQKKKKKKREWSSGSLSTPPPCPPVMLLSLTLLPSTSLALGQITLVKKKKRANKDAKGGERALSLKG